jgi:hypothetical protein
MSPVLHMNSYVDSRRFGVESALALRASSGLSARARQGQTSDFVAKNSRESAQPEARVRAKGLDEGRGVRESRSWECLVSDPVEE